MVPAIPELPRTETNTARADAGSPARSQAARPPTSRATPQSPSAPALTGADAIYLARDALTVPPKPAAPVAIDYPYFDGGVDHYTGEFDLYIDDTGGVVRVTSATSDLPRILIDAVREAFLSARFSPGEVEGRPVRSRMRIEVTFDNRRPPSS